MEGFGALVRRLNDKGYLVNVNMFLSLNMSKLKLLYRNIRANWQKAYHNSSIFHYKLDQCYNIFNKEEVRKIVVEELTVIADSGNEEFVYWVLNRFLK